MQVDRALRRAMLRLGGEAAIIWHRPRSGRSTFDQQHDLALWRARLVMREQFARCATAEFFEFLGELARDAELATGQNVDAGGERFRQAIRRLKINRCFLARGGSAQLPLALATFHRKKTAKEELFCPKS